VTLRRKVKSPFDGLTAKGKGAAGLEEYALVKDPSVVFVLVPAGAFSMGAVPGDGATKEGESPARTVTLGAYFIAKTETTFAQWGRFCVATQRPVPAAPAWATPEHPVGNVSWSDAKAYCAWAGVRLPSEAEWERAARARTTGALFAWGTDATPPAKAANLFDETRRKKLKIDITKPRFNDYDDGFPYTSPVGTFAANGFGLEDVTGNVWEWCADGYEADTSSLLANDPFVPPDQRPSRVLRGGCYDSKPADCRLSRRNPQTPDFRNDGTGFRVARDGPK
jgi:formylglycine-generating enzyme required for sulfatase activity